ncbi:lipoprotein [Serratia fonticola]|uniref:Lipoprotein n=1 Tax=Serratia fonticola TaxID=47917 RepID=A0AAW3WW91_SERFO|nr:lipoprotein [Serratia fonticola]MBC3213872.1 lipoprotein [Serratia fonticola]NYA13145.1 lipoprotein [Serratia fonticola]NYA33472.1 lipoprotein [Serratia fonticola]
MRKLLLALAATALLSGCSTGQLEKQTPIFSSHSMKTPQEYSKCLAPKWQAINSTASSIETEYGYQLVVQGLGAHTLAKIENDGNGGANIKVFAVAKGFGNPFGNSAKDCI